MQSPLMPNLPSIGMQTQCSVSGRSCIRSQSLACRDISRAPNRMVSLASGFSKYDYPTSFLENMDVEMARMQRSFLEVEKQMDAELQNIDKGAHEMQKGTVRYMKPDGSQTYRSEQHFEQRTGNGYFSGYQSESITYYGQPSAPLLHHQHMQPAMQTGFASLGVLALMFLIGTYLAVASRLSAVWDKTRYSGAEAARVVPIWPFLAVFSTDFRHEMWAALFGRNLEPDGGDGKRA